MPLEAQAPADFDFVIGDWTVQHHKLKERLNHCAEWLDFGGLSSTSKILGGLGNVEDNQLFFPEGPVRAAAFRSYDVRSRQWSIWWLDGRAPHSLDTPVIGSFAAGIGLFFANDVLGGVPIKIRFEWTLTRDQHPHWEQAFSPDDGRTWEVNWVMDFTPRDAQAAR
jgi:hypothetical protein